MRHCNFFLLLFSCYQLRIITRNYWENTKRKLLPPTNPIRQKRILLFLFSPLFWTLRQTRQPNKILGIFSIWRITYLNLLDCELLFSILEIQPQSIEFMLSLANEYDEWEFELEIQKRDFFHIIIELFSLINEVWE